jgi:hypothetical protein
VAFGAGILAATTGDTFIFDNISVRELPGNHAFQATAASRPVLSARVNLLTATETLATQSVTTVATPHTLIFGGTGSITLSGTATGTYSAGTHTFTPTAGTLTLTVSGSVTQADLRTSNVGVGLPAYQRVTTSTNYDTAGFPLYLRADGVDDGMVTNSIDFTATDKMTVVAGVRKLSDAAFMAIAELSSDPNTVNGSFSISAALLRTDRQTWSSIARGTTNSQGGARVFASPDTRIATALLDIGAATPQTENVLRLNAVQQTLDFSDSNNAGTGNFGNYPMFIGRRGGTASPFNGRLYSLIVRGAQSTAAQIAATETYVNSKTKAFA